MNLREAAEMALEALESVYGKGKRCEAAIEALRQALAEDDVLTKIKEAIKNFKPSVKPSAIIEVTETGAHLKIVSLPIGIHELYEERHVGEKKSTS